MIRHATEADAPAIRALDLAAWSSTFSPSPPPAPGADIPPLLADGLTVLVAEVEGEVAGYVNVGRSLPMESNSHVLEIRGINVGADFRGLGIGHDLMAAAEGVARERGARKIKLRVLGPNAAARSLYESCGYIVEGVLRDEFLLDGEYLDDILMARRLES